MGLSVSSTVLIGTALLRNREQGVTSIDAARSGSRPSELAAAWPSFLFKPHSGLEQEQSMNTQCRMQVWTTAHQL
jgi:hypothetical protein